MGDCNIYGGFASGVQTEAKWGSITGDISEQTDLSNELDKKIEREEGKTLSTNDFTDSDKEKLDKLNNIYIFPLSSDNWEYLELEEVYKQRIEFENIKETDTVIADIELSKNEETAEKEKAIWNRVESVIISDGYMTIYIKDNAPDITINLKVKI